MFLNISAEELPQLKYSVRNLCSGYQCDSVLHNMQSLFEEHLKKANSGSEEH